MWVVGSRGDNNVKQVHSVILNVNLSYNPFWKFEFARNATAWFDQSLTILDDTWRYLAILDDTWRYLTCIPFSFLLFPLFFSSASVSITGIAPPGGLLSAAPKPWDQVSQVGCLSRWFCTYLILMMSLNFDWMHSLYWSWNPIYHQ